VKRERKLAHSCIVP